MGNRNGAGQQLFNYLGGRDSRHITHDPSGIDASIQFIQVLEQISHHSAIRGEEEEEENVGADCT